MHIGHRRAGRAGLVVAGLAFLLPAVLIVAALAWLYVVYGRRPEVAALLGGIAPVVVAIVAHAGWSIARTTLRSPVQVALLAAAVAAIAAGVPEIAVLLGAGFISVGLVAALRGRAAAIGMTAWTWPGRWGFGGGGSRRPGRSRGRRRSRCRRSGSRRCRCCRDRHAGPHPRDVPQDRRGPVRQRLRPRGVAPLRARGRARLDHRDAAPRCRRGRPGHARSAVLDRDLHRLRRRRTARRRWPRPSACSCPPFSPSR